MNNDIEYDNKVALVFFTSEKLLERINEVGIDKIRFIVPMKKTGIITPLGLAVSNSDPDVETVCKITEHRYKLKDNYKISLIPENENGYTEHYYLTDLAHLIRQEFVKIV